MQMKTEKDLKEIASATELPFIVKGVMTAESARKALNAGAYAVVVSNHGGRVMDNGLSTAEVLPEIREAAGNQRGRIFVDSMANPSGRHSSVSRRRCKTTSIVQGFSVGIPQPILP